MARARQAIAISDRWRRRREDEVVMLENELNAAWQKIAELHGDLEAMWKRVG